MNKKIIDKFIILFFIISVIILTVILYMLFDNMPLSATDTKSIPNTQRRIASLAPSITEIIYRLELDDILIADTEYCLYPEDAKNKIHIGSFNQINYELILSMGIDTVLITDDQIIAKSILEGYKIKTIVVDNRNINGILDSIKIIGDEFNRGVKADMVIEDINNRLDKINCDIDDDRRVMLVVFQEMSSDDIGKITVAADDNYYNDMIARAGGRNIFADTMAAYPVVDKEAIIRANPDIIIQLMKPGDDKESIIKRWLNMKEVNASRDKSVYLLEDISSSIPGPRFIDTLENIVKIICTEEKNANSR